jgi:hypothetical protein
MEAKGWGLMIADWREEGPTLRGSINNIPLPNVSTFIQKKM